MLDNRIKLRDRLVELLPGVTLYYQAPPSNQMEYPCVLYSQRSAIIGHADDRPYLHWPVYDVTFISKDPDDPAVFVIGKNLVGARYDRHWIVDNLHHTNFAVG